MDNFNKCCPLVSVVVPIYNVEKYIPKCMESIANQTYKNLEVLLVNDGTPDGSGEMARKFSEKDERFTYLEKENGGLSSARNMGLENAHGEFIYFLDSDDWIEPESIEHLVNGFSDPEIDIVIGKYVLDDGSIGKKYVPYDSERIDRVYSDGDKEREIIERHLNPYPEKGYQIKDTLMPVWKNMYRMEMLKKYDLTFVSERKVGLEDYVFNYMAYHYADKVRMIPHTVCVHIVVQNSLSKKYYADACERALCLHECVLDFTEENGGEYINSRKKALADKLASTLSGQLYSIAASNVDHKKNKFSKYFKIPVFSALISGVKHPNIEHRFQIIYQIIRRFGPKGSVPILVSMNKVYGVYRWYQYLSRR